VFHAQVIGYGTASVKAKRKTSPPMG
jgi:hypothetical protein